MIEAERARRYCWQFWEELVVYRREVERGTYAAVEVSHEYQKHAAWDIGTSV